VTGAMFSALSMSHTKEAHNALPLQCLVASSSSSFLRAVIRQLGAHLAERLRPSASRAARAAGHQGDAALQAEEI